MHTQVIFSFSRWLSKMFRFIYIFVFKHCFDFIPTDSLTFHIPTIDARSLFHKRLRILHCSLRKFCILQVLIFLCHILSISSNIYKTLLIKLWKIPGKWIIFLTWYKYYISWKYFSIFKSSNVFLLVVFNVL